MMTVRGPLCGVTMLPLVMFFFPLVFVVLGYFIYLRMKQEGIL